MKSGEVQITYKSSENLRELQLVQTKMLEDIVDVCEKEHLTYYLTFGTLLGAVRHKGAIPWDDDVDIVMPIEDYRRFLRIGQEKLGDEYFLQTSMTDPNFNFAYAKVCKNNTTFLYTHHRSYHIHHGIFVDVFPLVPIRSKRSLKIKKRVLSLSNFVQIKDKMGIDIAEFKELLGPVGLKTVQAFSLLHMRLRQTVHNAMINYCFSGNYDKCENLAVVWCAITYDCPKEIFTGEKAEVLYEGRVYNAPPDYKQFLTITYGDYMTPPPEEERQGHGENIILDFNNSYERYMI